MGHLTYNHPAGWKGFQKFAKSGGNKTALDNAMEFIGRFDDVHLRPVFWFGYEPMIRSFSSRFANRALGWLFLHLKKAKDVGDNTQAAHRFNGDGTRAQLLENGLHAGTLVATDDDYKTMASYHPYFRTIMETISDDYCNLEHVFTGGEDNVLARIHAPMKFSVRGFASAKMIRQTGDPMRAVKVSTRGPERGPTVLEAESFQEAARAQVSNIRSAARRAREEEDDVNPRPINQPRTDDGIPAPPPPAAAPLAVALPIRAGNMRVGHIAVPNGTAQVLEYTIDTIPSGYQVKWMAGGDICVVEDRTVRDIQTHVRWTSLRAWIAFHHVGGVGHGASYHTAVFINNGDGLWVSFRNRVQR
jgi:hypothetical protein